VDWKYDTGDCRAVDSQFDASGKIILSHATWTPSCPYEMRESYLPTKRAPGSLRGNQGPKA